MDLGLGNKLGSLASSRCFSSEECLRLPWGLKLDARILRLM